MLSTSDLDRAVSYAKTLNDKMDTLGLFNGTGGYGAEGYAANVEARGRIIAAILSQSKIDRHDSL